jgi:hypothetical protein
MVGLELRLLQSQLLLQLLLSLLRLLLLLC